MAEEKILFVDDEGSIRETAQRFLTLAGYTVTTAAGGAEALQACGQNGFALVFTDLKMPGMDGEELLRRIKELSPITDVVIVTAYPTLESAIQTLKAGAYDYLLKPFELADLERTAERCLEKQRLKRELIKTQLELKKLNEQLEEKVKERTAALEYQATHDTLVGLPNRNLLHDRLQQAILSGRRENKPLALLIMDLDHFKDVNDTLGHPNGDLLLQQIGPRLRGVLRESDTVARLGGDEFAVLLPIADVEDAVLVAQKIRKALEAPFVLEGLTIGIEGGIGIAVFPEHGANANSLIQRADVAMYMAKQAGSGYAVYAPEQDPHNPRRLALMGELRHAIDRDQLLLHYQPKINLKTGRVAGVEALVRWQHPQYGLIPPDQFIAPAERTGLIKPLTLWVLNEALRQCHAWHQASTEISVAVNLSARNLQDAQLPDQIAGLSEACGVAPACLELEITEGAIMTNPAHAMEILTRLSDMGVMLSIDDFGTGYSSLAYLRRLPVHEVKIDKSFVMEMTVDGSAAAIVRSIIDLGHELGLKVVAEGVENKAIQDRLAALGCDAAQGYYISRPLPVKELTRWLSESP